MRILGHLTTLASGVLIGELGACGTEETTGW